MASAPRSDTVLRLADLNDRKAHDILLTPDEPTMAKIATELKLIALKKMRFAGKLTPKGKRGWTLSAQLGATVVQPCVVTLDPVTTRIEEEVIRRYTPDTEAYQARSDGSGDGDGVPMPEDDTIEPLPATLDLQEVMVEALALALPLYPRADGVDLGEAVYAEKGTAPLRDDDLKPFAGLAGLRDKLAKDDNDDGSA
ncbi:YceD family protein [Pseudooceanicola sp. MF1-13]|uniref:YceD family protein n=1 Tax=Pseudooceanicola sp. MF1-13 TaxID=3379095 RepID=UPI0038925214